MFRENEYRASNGLTTLLLLIVVGLASFAGLLKSAQAQMPAGVIVSLLVLVVTCVLLGGLFIVNPGDAKALVLFGGYKGTVKTPGFWFANPFITKRRISLRIRNFERSSKWTTTRSTSPCRASRPCAPWRSRIRTIRTPTTKRRSRRTRRKSPSRCRWQSRTGSRRPASR